MAPERTRDDGPSREEVQQRINSLYDQAESFTGTFNATRAMKLGIRRRVNPAPDNARRRSDPVLDEVARPWFDVGRAQLGPTVPAVLPPDRRPARATQPRPARPAAPPAELTARVVAELTAGPVAALPAGPRPHCALPGRTAGRAGRRTVRRARGRPAGGARATAGGSAGPERAFGRAQLVPVARPGRRCRSRRPAPCPPRTTGASPTRWPRLAPSRPRSGSCPSRWARSADPFLGRRARPSTRARSATGTTLSSPNSPSSPSRSTSPTRSP